MSDIMRQRLSNLLLEIHFLLREENRDRGIPAGPQLERDVECLANLSWLPSHRRTNQAPFGGAYYSGLQPETDLFVYDGPQFLQIEIKDRDISRVAVTELWARALDLHLGNSNAGYHPGNRTHYVALVVAGVVDDRFRGACLRWGINLVEALRIPIPALASLIPNSDKERIACGCTARDLETATTSFDRRFPSTSTGILLPFGRFRAKSVVESVLRFQALVSVKFYGGARNNPLRRSAA